MPGMPVVSWLPCFLFFSRVAEFEKRCCLFMRTERTVLYTYLAVPQPGTCRWKGHKRREDPDQNACLLSQWFYFLKVFPPQCQYTVRSHLEMPHCCRHLRSLFVKVTLISKSGLVVLCEQTVLPAGLRTASLSMLHKRQKDSLNVCLSHS